jgi:NADH-quinone oxidoreductase subunit N
MKWMIAAPEIYTFAAACWFLMLSLVARPDAKREHLTSLSLSALGVLVCLASLGADGYLFIKAYRVDFFSQIFKVLLSLGLFLIICLCGEMKDIRERNRFDFYFLLFTCTLAMMLLVSADHLLAIYISLELSSYSLYILVALRKDQDLGLEAGLKYFLVGSLASAVMLFGLALLYAGAQATYLSELVKVLPAVIGHPAVILGLLFTLCGFFFKLAIFPFHFWAPDTYQGAMNQVAAYIATASKVAAIGVILRVVALAGQDSTYLVNVLVILSIVSMTVGNLAAIAQKDFKRLLAFSTIAHSGYVLIGILAMNRAGYAGAIFYALALLVMKFTVFLVVVKVACDGQNIQIRQLAGLHRRSPILALALMVSLFSLAGIPPTIGFTGKFLVFVAAMERGYFTLVLIGMINVVISLYYYLLVIKAAYLLEPEGELPVVRTSPSMKLLAGALVAVIVATGFFPYYFLELSEVAAQVLMRG